MGNVDVLLGLQFGDEGKGKIIDELTTKYRYVARFAGGPNAGHTLYHKGKKIVLHTVPSGIIRDNTINIIGNGVVVDPYILMQEIETLNDNGIKTKNRIILSNRSHIITPIHKIQDLINEESKKIGTTLRGIGPVYTDKVSRNGIRFKDLEGKNIEDYKEVFDSYIKNLPIIYHELIEERELDLEEMYANYIDGLNYVQTLDIIKTEFYVNDILKNNDILAEGAQGTMLDVDFGTYPYVTSSNTTIGGVVSGLGIPPQKVRKVYGVMKAYSTRVGEGPFRTEITDSDVLCKKGSEVGATTGRKRRCGWLDLKQIKYSCMINGVTDLIVTKVDILSDMDEIKVYSNKENYITLKSWKSTDVSSDMSYMYLPKELTYFLNLIRLELSTEINMISIGPNREDIIYL